MSLRKDAGVRAFLKGLLPRLGRAEGQSARMLLGENLAERGAIRGLPDANIAEELQSLGRSSARKSPISGEEFADSSSFFPKRRLPVLDFKERKISGAPVDKQELFREHARNLLAAKRARLGLRGVKPPEAMVRLFPRPEVSATIPRTVESAGGVHIAGPGGVQGWRMSSPFLKEASLSFLLLRKTAQGTVSVPAGGCAPEIEKAKKERKKPPFQGFIDFQGLRIDVENLKGSTRKGKAKDGTEWSTHMYHHYGELRGTEGVDGDLLDAYVGPNGESPLVVVIHQQNPDTKKFDEDKVMLGFNSVKEAIRAYKKQYGRPGLYQGHRVLNIGQFWNWVHDEEKRGKKVAPSGVVEKKAGAPSGSKPFPLLPVEQEKPKDPGVAPPKRSLPGRTSIPLVGGVRVSSVEKGGKPNPEVKLSREFTLNKGDLLDNRRFLAQRTSVSPSISVPTFSGQDPKAGVEASYGPVTLGGKVGLENPGRDWSAYLSSHGVKVETGNSGKGRYGRLSGGGSIATPVGQPAKWFASLGGTYAKDQIHPEALAGIELPLR